MKPVSDDESLLSAYLDGELDTSRRLQVEAALLSSPLLAARLRDLAHAREAVRSLPRPGVPRDLSSAVVARVATLDSDRARQAQARRQTARRLLAATPLAAAAAALLTIWALGRSGPAPAPAEPVRSGVPTPAPGDLAGPLPPAPAQEPAASAPAVVAVATAGTVPSALSEAERQRSAEQARLQTLLGRAAVRRINLSVARLDEAALKPIDEAVRQTPRTHPDFARLALAPGLGLDPLATEGAVVFAVVLDRHEADGLQGKLAKLAASSATLTVESVEPGLVARLGETQDLVLGADLPTATMVAGARPEVDTLQARQIRTDSASAPVRSSADPDAVSEPATARDPEPDVYLIWVTPLATAEP